MNPESNPRHSRIRPQPTPTPATSPPASPSEARRIYDELQRGRNYADDLTKWMPDHLKHLAPTHEELDMVTEELSGIPVDRGSLAANVDGLRQRVAFLCDQINGIATHQSEGTFGPESNEAEPMLAELRAELARARELLAGYENQQDKQN